MGTAKSFTELDVWIKARELCTVIYRVTKREGLNHDFALVNQINRSSGSIMDNIAEGFERGSNKEFIQFLYIAKGSAGEVLSQLFRTYDRHYIDEIEMNEYKGQVEHISAMIGKLIIYLKNSELKGKKFS